MSINSAKVSLLQNCAYLIQFPHYFLGGFVSMNPDNYVFKLLEEIHELLHRIEGYKDAQEYLKKTNLRFVEDDPKEIPFPENKKQPLARKQEAIFSQQKNGHLDFTEQELLKMPKNFQKLFRTNKVIAHVRLCKGK